MKHATSTAMRESVERIAELKALYRTEDYWKFTTEVKEHVYEKVLEAIPDFYKKNPELYNLLEEYPKRRGHYSRPLLLILSALSLSDGSDKELFNKAIELGAIIQLSEEWILVHDDIMDGASMRRGKPTLHGMVGPEIAMLVGDILHNAMAEAMHNFAQKYGAQGDKIYKVFNNEIGNATALGKYLDLKFTKLIRDPGAVGEDFYIDIVNGKTLQYTVKGPMVLAAILAGKGPDMIEKIVRIAESAGIAFQINDDLIDMKTGAKSGKDQYGDLYEGKLTLIIHHAYTHATTEEKSRILEIYRKDRKDKTQEDIEFLKGVISKYNSMQYVEAKKEEAEGSTWKNMQEYAKEMPSNKYASWLLATILMLYNRD